MNYRHGFHAGNFADLLKHALLIWLIERLGEGGPVTVVETHAGAGLYDLQAVAARSREAEAGVARLMTADDRPAPLQRLSDAMRARNVGAVRWYPGSPLLALEAMGEGGRYVGCELNPEQFALLAERLGDFPNAKALPTDGYDALPGVDLGRNGLVLIDPPFERPDDYARAAVAAASARRRGAVVAVWTPLKDLETFDGFLRALEGAGATEASVCEVRLRPLTDPMKMNGCALVVLGAPDGFDAVAGEVAGWLADTLGEAGSLGRCTRL